MEFNVLIKFRLDVFSNTCYLGHDVCFIRKHIVYASLSFVMLKDVNAQRSSSCSFWHDPRSFFCSLLTIWLDKLFRFIMYISCPRHELIVFIGNFVSLY